MPLALAGDATEHRMTADAFHRFQIQRPDHERWELIAGYPIMMSPVVIVHNRIASNLERLLNDALEGHDPSRTALQRLGVELGGDDTDKPEPDIVVFDSDFQLGQRFIDRVYLLGEIVSSTDDKMVPGTGRPWIEIKSELYRAHAPCTAVVLVEQQRIALRLWRRVGASWIVETLAGSDAELDLPEFGLRCRLGALYQGTPLTPRSPR